MEEQQQQQQKQEQQQQQQEQLVLQKQHGPPVFQHEFEDLELSGGFVSRKIEELCNHFRRHFELLRPQVMQFLLLAAAVGYFVYFGFAMHCERLQTEGSVRLLVMTCLVVVGFCFRAVNWYCGRSLLLTDALATVSKAWARFQAACGRNSTMVSTFGFCMAAAYLLACISLAGVRTSENLVSGAGVLAILLVCVLVSAHPTRIRWRPVLGGLCIQVTFAALLLRTQRGFKAFSFLGDRMMEFILHVETGAKFVFGDTFKEHYFAFAVLPMIIFFSSFTSLMFHLGVLPFIIQNIGLAMKVAMGTTAGESLVAAANIFIGMMEAPLLIAPFALRMTQSELHSVISCGYATIAGAGMAAYISMGVPARHLISASFMVAPGALAVSKLMYPETKKSLTDVNDIGSKHVGKSRNVIDAMGRGAAEAGTQVASIAVNLISFITMLTFVNATLTWFGDRICLGMQLTFESICGYILWPVAFILGVGAKDCFRVAELIGTKFFINEFVAYQRFITYQKGFQEFTKLNATSYEWIGDNVFIPDQNITIDGGLLFEKRSISIATYALCGFANVGSVGMQLATFTMLMPVRKEEVMPLIIRGVFTGTLANLLTAGVAGIFI